MTDNIDIKNQAKHEVIIAFEKHAEGIMKSSIPSFKTISEQMTYVILRNENGLIQAIQTYNEQIKEYQEYLLSEVKKEARKVANKVVYGNGVFWEECPFCSLENKYTAKDIIGSHIKCGCGEFILPCEMCQQIFTICNGYKCVEQITQAIQEIEKINGADDDTKI